MSNRSARPVVGVLALVCVFTPSIRQPILGLLGAQGADPFHATERYVGREVANLGAYVRDLGAPFGAK